MTSAMRSSETGTGRISSINPSQGVPDMEGRGAESVTGLLTTQAASIDIDEAVDTTDEACARAVGADGRCRAVIRESTEED